jgi:hypothetical protein
MNKLVIHPKDRTTDFLKPIYHGRNDTTVLTGGCTKQEVEQAIDKHDHIIMLGHGTPQGLLAMAQFNGKPKPSYKPSEIIRSSAGSKPVTSEHIKDFYAQPEDDWFQGRSVGATSYQYGAGNLTNGYVIDDMTTGKLDGKKLTAIWCNADQYMEWNDLEGFYTGMFISDEGEAKMIGVSDTEAWQVEESNYAFVSVVRRFIDHSPEKLRDALMLEYGEMAERNAVAKYNLMRFYTRKASQGQLVTA